jgi:NADH-quinone oxidoreductase subunit J
MNLVNDCLLPPPQGSLPLALIDWHAALFLLFALVACGAAVMVVLTDNVVRMALHLVLSLGATAGLFFLAGAEFVGSMQLMIYVGGTLVLLVFGVMLTAQTKLVALQTPPGDRVIAGILAAALLAVLVQSAVSIEPWRRPGRAEVQPPSATPLGMALVGVRVDSPAAESESRRRSGYLLPFEIVSVHLLVVLVGAAYLARAKRRRTPRPIDVVASADPPPPPQPGRPERREATSVLVGSGR